MGTNWLPLQSFPREGRRLVLDDPRVWEDPIAEFGLACRIVEPLRAQMQIFPQDRGVLFRGRLTGTIVLPCVLCTEDSLVVLDQRFDSFEPFPADPALREERDESPAHEVDEAVIRITPHGGYELNPAGLAWEEFSLALPVNPLCREDCRGLCPLCGANRNREDCGCERPEGDPRLACLRDVVLAGKQKNQDAARGRDAEEKDHGCAAE
ncbi:MAG: DUF177 domain-containing protein [Desulfovibrio sp.]|jgi:uncharacterized protein|nr:DUF177 domain-containing protein [Desulfovibrio sp.]